MFSIGVLGHDYTRIFSAANLVGLIGLWAIFKLSITIYNISLLHPLSRFPGPKLVAYEQHSDDEDNRR
jgi:hypothetical protein